MTHAAPLTRDAAREAFKRSGLAYADVMKPAVMEDLRRRIEARFAAAALMPDTRTGKPTLRMHPKAEMKKGPHGPWADLRCRAYYFKDRQAVTLDPSGFVGFAGWASDENVAPILEGFVEWVAAAKEAKDLAAAASELAVRLGPGEGRPTYVVSTVVDADPFAAPFLDALAKAGRPAGYACLWVENSDLGDGVRIAPIVHQSFESADPAPIDLVILVSRFLDASVARTAILRFANPSDAAGVTVVSMIALEDEFEKLQASFEDGSRFRLLAGVSLRSGQPEAGSIRTSADVLGYRSTDEVNQTMPDLVRARLERRRRGGKEAA